MTQIDVIMLISGLDDAALKRRSELLKIHASPGTNLRLVTTENAPLSVESQAEMELAAPGILKRVVQSENEGSDAVIIWGGHDPSLEASRELVSIPVLGPGMASMLIALSLAKRFALLVQLSGVIDIAENQIRKLGVQDKCIGIYPVEIPVLQLRNPESFDKVNQIAINAINDGADALCFGCMAMNDHVPQLNENLKRTYPGVIVIHPGEAVIKLAEMLIKMNLTHSKRSYPTPIKEIFFPN